MPRHALIAVLLLAVPLAVQPLWAAATPEQQQQAGTAEELIRDAGKSILAKKYDEAVPLLEKAQQMLAELSAAGIDGKKLAAGLDARAAAARRILESKGVKVAAPPKVTPKPAGAPTTSGGISFTKQIAPIFVARCNNCHVTGTRGGFNLGTFANLTKGSQSGIVINPGKGDGSRLIEVLDSGDMPRGGGKLPDDQIALISKWIDEGAKFDGTDPNAAIAPAGATPNATQQLKVVQASGNESTRFSRDVASVIADQCIRCHAGQQPAGQLSLATFQRLLAGSQNGGPILTPGKPAESMLIRKIKGLAGDRMPKNAPPLSDETIAKFEKWVAEGAKFDGFSPTMEVEMVAAIYKASVMSHEDLAAERMTLGLKNWELANPDDKPDKIETDNFVLYGNVGESELERIGHLAETQLDKVTRILRAGSVSHPVKGRITLFVFKRRYDYSELGRMVERREIPDGWSGHYRFNVVDAYAAIVPPQGNEYSLNSLIAEQLAGVYLDSLSKEGKLPTWFSQGSAWAVGATADAKDPRSRAWDDSVPGILAGAAKPEDFLENKLPPGDTAVLNYSFCKFLMSNARGYTALLTGLRDKKDFDQAFREAYRAEPKQIAPAWAGKAIARRK
jgi:mono/diheme cytochrome c family protein